MSVERGFAVNNFRLNTNDGMSQRCFMNVNSADPDQSDVSLVWVFAILLDMSV